MIRYLRSKGISCTEFTKQHGALSDKEVRAHDASPRFEEHRVLFPRMASWLSILESELLTFPNAAHDDCVDVCSYAVLVAPWNKGGIFFENKGRGDIFDALGVNRPDGM